MSGIVHYGMKVKNEILKHLQKTLKETFGTPFKTAIQKIEEKT